MNVNELCEKMENEKKVNCKKIIKIKEIKYNI